MKYTIEKVIYAPKLFHNDHQMRRVKAFEKKNGLFVHRIPMSKSYRIAHISGYVLPKIYKKRKDALSDCRELQVKNWSNYKDAPQEFKDLYIKVTQKGE